MQVGFVGLSELSQGASQIQACRAEVGLVGQRLGVEVEGLLRLTGSYADRAEVVECFDAVRFGVEYIGIGGDGGFEIAALFGLHGGQQAGAAHRRGPRCFSPRARLTSQVSRL